MKIDYSKIRKYLLVLCSVPLLCAVKVIWSTLYWVEFCLILERQPFETRIEVSVHSYH